MVVNLWLLQLYSKGMESGSPDSDWFRRVHKDLILPNPSASPSPQGDHTWATMLGQSVRLQPVLIQSLSELERARLQEVALYHLDERDLDFKISIPKGTETSWANG